jgi:preprotein translocase subunit SecA
MGLFGNRNQARKIDDRIWIKKEQMFGHLFSDAANSVNQGKSVLLAYYFSDTGSFLESQLTKQGISFTVLDNVRPEIEEKVNMVQADLLGSSYFLEKLAAGTREVLILFAEHYPLFNKEETVVKSIASLGNHVSYCFYCSFDELILARFGAEKVLGLLQKHGVNEEEMMSNPLISDAITHVQKKIQSKVIYELNAFSAEEWFKNNLKKKGE